MDSVQQGNLIHQSLGSSIVELILSILALTQGKVDILQESLIGIMLSNLLLVLRLSLFLGGLNRIE